MTAATTIRVGGPDGYDVVIGHAVTDRAVGLLGEAAERVLVVHPPTLAAWALRLADAVRDALLGAPFADRLAASGQALLAFRETQPDPVAVLLRNPLRRIHDQVAAHGSIPALDLH